MAYTLKYRKQENNIFKKIVIKLGRILAKDFPYYKVRRRGLLLCGYTVGEKVYVGLDLIVTGFISDNSCKLVIEDRVAIGPRVTLLLASDANWSKLMENREVISGTIILKKDCWIGAGAIIMPNITIGERAIVGAGAVVTKDVDADTVVVGVPAKVLIQKKTEG